MFTEAEFTAAMHRAVEKRGGDYKFPRQSEQPKFFTEQGVPRYTTRGGKAACLIGAVLHELGQPVHADDTRSALGVLSGRVPEKVKCAARLAQIHQDRRYTWAEALAVYEAALTIDTEDTWYDQPTVYAHAVSVATGGTISDAVASVEETVKAMEALSKAIEATKVEFAFGSLKTTLYPSAFTSTGVTIHGIGYSAATTSSATVVASKKDHALVA